MMPRAPFTALVVTLAVQMIASVGMTSPSVLAPVIAGEIGVGAQHVGWLVSLAYFAAMLSGLAGGWTAARFGSVRSSQGSLIASAAGMALMASGHPAALLLGALVLGIGYGLPNPTAADILSRHAPPERRGLFFSIKQTGVPLGVALTGVLVPALLGIMAWSPAVLCLSLGMILAAAAIGPASQALEPARLPQPKSRPGDSSGAVPPARLRPIALLRSGLIEPLLTVMRFGPTRRLAITSLVYAFTQVSFLTFLVSLLKLQHGYSLALAASVLAGSQAVSVAARIGWGHVADRWIDPTRVLGLLGLGMGLSIAALGLMPAGSPTLVVVLISLACAGTAVSWNGVYYADLVRQVPPERVAQTTGATQFLTFMGGMSGTASFAALVSLTGSYSVVYAGLAVMPAITGLALLSRGRTAAGISNSQG